MTELEEIQKNYIQHMIEEKQKELQENANLIEEFQNYAQTKGIILTSENFDYIQTIGIVARFPNLVEYICPNIKRDKEGLIDFNFLLNSFEIKPFVISYLYANNFMLMAHPYFRRGLNANANFAPRFTDIFWHFNHTKLNSSIAIDFDRVRINVDNRMYMEFDTWYGANFSNQINQIPDGIVKLRPPSDINNFLIEFYFADAYSLDIKWETKNSIKTFQAEEFKTDKIKITKNGITFFPVRYIHAEFDLNKNVFRHFDGAVHFYTEEEYYNRRDSDFNYNNKNGTKIKSDSQKLFKFNGEISVDTWIEFSSHFFTGNPLIIEYLEGKYPVIF